MFKKTLEKNHCFPNDTSRNYSLLHVDDCLKTVMYFLGSVYQTLGLGILVQRF